MSNVVVGLFEVFKKSYIFFGVTCESLPKAFLPLFCQMFFFINTSLLVRSYTINILDGGLP